jgi:hypothetical protein
MLSSHWGLWLDWWVVILHCWLCCAVVLHLQTAGAGEIAWRVVQASLK